MKRFYKNELPNVDDMVIVKITREDDHGYYGSLIEYDNIEGYLPLSEVVKGKYAKKHILKEEQLIPLIVIKVDTHKKFIDLSKKKVDKEQESYILLKYKICNNINKLVNECYIMYLKYCDLSSSDIIHTMNDIMNQTIWKMYDGETKDYTIIFKNILENPKLILSEDLFSGEFIDKAIENFNSRIVKKSMIMEMDFNLVILENNALGKLKEILSFQITENKYYIDIIVISPPLYRIRIEGYNKDLGFEIMKQIKNSIIAKLQLYKHIVKFGDIDVVSDCTYEIKFMGNYELETLMLK
jgi:translation initiation factor 2 subunit 1